MFDPPQELGAEILEHGSKKRPDDYATRSHEQRRARKWATLALIRFWLRAWRVRGFLTLQLPGTAPPCSGSSAGGVKGDWSPEAKTSIPFSCQTTATTPTTRFSFFHFSRSLLEFLSGILLVEGPVSLFFATFALGLMLSTRAQVSCFYV